ncbi:MAG: ribonuclease P protein component [Alphaproteobacteria bacterium]|jgi:ribonuclease P protein component|nr:ribonuclease P protein component [Alphaproteobacteria bacterium]HJP22471.1 ribonuclease P protein component [Alphaproteobacteria bacterium]
MTARLGRLKRRSEFLRVAAARQKWVAPGLIVQMRRRRPEPAGKDGLEPGFRVGYTVSKKVGNAVARNRARRRLRSAAAEVLPGKGVAGRDYVLIGRQGTLTRPYRDLVDDLEMAMERLGRKAAVEAEGIMLR